MSERRSEPTDPASGIDGASAGGSDDDDTPAIRLAPMRWAHLSEVLTIEGRSFPNPWPREGFAYELNRDFSHPEVALDPEGRVLGYCISWHLFERAQIQNIAVHPEARRLGIALRLLRSAIRRASAAGAEALYLEVRVGNLAARRLYEREGFELSGRHKDHYTDPREDAFLLRRSLERR